MLFYKFKKLVYNNLSKYVFMSICQQYIYMSTIFLFVNNIYICQQYVFYVFLSICILCLSVNMYFMSFCLPTCLYVNLTVSARMASAGFICR